LLEYISFIGDVGVKIYLLKNNKFLFSFIACLSAFLSPSTASDFKDYYYINMLVRDCYQNISYCNDALLKINKYQKDSEIDKNFSCQTRLLGLEANLIMAMNSNLKRKEVKRILDDISKYC
tara:strand:- start:1799 stop:2161 length:363 start_codon:yes stop_codon:yes gene_type:complete